MSQASIPITPELETALSEYMRLRHLQSRVEAVRQALEEALEKEHSVQQGRPDFSKWIGLARRAPDDPSPQFQSDDDLWE